MQPRFLSIILLHTKLLLSANPLRQVGLRDPGQYRRTVSGVATHASFRRSTVNSSVSSSLIIHDFLPASTLPPRCLVEEGRFIEHSLLLLRGFRKWLLPAFPLPPRPRGVLYSPGIAGVVCSEVSSSDPPELWMSGSTVAYRSSSENGLEPLCSLALSERKLLL